MRVWCNYVDNGRGRPVVTLRVITPLQDLFIYLNKQTKKTETLDETTRLNSPFLYNKPYIKPAASLRDQGSRRAVTPALFCRMCSGRSSPAGDRRPLVGAQGTVTLPVHRNESRMTATLRGETLLIVTPLPIVAYLLYNK